MALHESSVAQNARTTLGQMVVWGGMAWPAPPLVVCTLWTNTLGRITKCVCVCARTNRIGHPTQLVLFPFGVPCVFCQKELRGGAKEDTIMMVGAGKTVYRRIGAGPPKTPIEWVGMAKHDAADPGMDQGHGFKDTGFVRSVQIVPNPTAKRRRMHQVCVLAPTLQKERERELLQDLPVA